jgi:flavin-dependent dehydrogenase
MAKKYDLVVVGAGPGGAMAAKTAGENGLKTAILERKTNPADIRRGCAMMFAVESDYYFGERMYFNDKSKKMIFPVNGFTVDYDGPTRNFYAWHFYAPDGKTRIEFGDYEKSIKQGDKGRLSFVYDKGKLIEGLMKEAVGSGVDVFTGINVDGVEKTAQGVRVTGNGDGYEGTFVIAADGINSRIANLMGFNKDRKFYGLLSGLFFYIAGFTIPQSEVSMSATYFKRDAQTPSSFFLVPSPYAEDEYWMSSRSPEDFEYATKESVYASWFPDLKVRRVHTALANMWSPVSEPYKDNVLLVGDSTWYIEAEITGSMMCGRRAANSVALALRDGKPGREGIKSYIEWWKRSYPEFDDYRNFMTSITFRILFSEAELNYLYGLFKTPLRASLNPFRKIRNLKSALQPMMSRIEEEMPSVFEKLGLLEVDRIEKVLLDIKGKAPQ